MQINLRTKTLKLMIKDEKPNKYVLEAVKSRDPVHALFGGMSRVTGPTF